MENEKRQEIRREFVASVKDLLSQGDVFGLDPIILRVGSRDLSVSVTDKEKKIVRTAFYEKSDEGYVFLEADHVYHPFENGILKYDALHAFHK